MIGLAVALLAAVALAIAALVVAVQARRRLAALTAGLEANQARGGEDGMLCLRRLSGTSGDDLAIEMVNLSAATLLHLPMGFGQGKALGVVMPAWKDAVIPRLLHALACGGSEQIDIEMPRGDGRTRALRLQAERRADLLVVTIEDRTGHRSAQRILSEREAHLRLVLETIFDGVVVLDELGHIVASNSAMTRVFGYQPGELGGKRLSDLLPGFEESDKSAPRLLYDSEHRMIGTGRELQGRRKDGRSFDVEVAICEGDQGEDRIFVGVIHDISARKRAEAEIRQAGDLLRQVIDAAPNIITLKGVDGRYILANRAAAAFLASEADAIIGKRLEEVTRDKDLGQSLQAEDDEIVRTGQPIDTERLTARAGGDCWFRTNKRLITLHDGRPCVLSVNTDITALRTALAAAEAARAEVEEVHRAQSAFLAGVSHEVRTPLNGVQGMAELLIKSGLSPEQEEYAQLLHRAGDAVLVLLNDILDYSKIEAGKLELERIDFDLGVVVYDVVELFRPRVADGAVDLVVDLGPTLPRAVMGDPGRLRQVLTNLLSNAVKFTRAGHVLVAVRTSASAGGDWWYEFAIEDTGIGIAEAHLSRLFSPFQQADVSMARRFGGTGLGLAISRRLIELMGGAITVTSVEGQGTRFVVRLPLGRQARFPEVLPPILPTGLRVLVVDDHALTRSVFISILREAGVEANEAASAGDALGQLGIAAAHGRAYDLALIDAGLPGLGGEAFAQAVGFDPTLSSTRLVLIAATPQRGDAARFAQAGYQGFLVKPVRSEILLAALGEIISRARRNESGLVTRHTVAEAQVQVAARERQTLPCLKVLLVEDNAINQRVMSAMLSHLGANPALASDGRAALERLKEEYFDVVLLDCHMPGLDGFQTVAALRARERDSGGHQRVIAMTGDTQAGDRERCMNAGMDDYLAKPVSEDALYAALAKRGDHG